MARGMERLLKGEHLCAGTPVQHDMVDEAVKARRGTKKLQRVHQLPWTLCRDFYRRSTRVS
jgi:outer membrane protein W